MIKIQSVTDDSFRKYGRIVEDVDVSSLIEAMKKTELPDDGTVYHTSIPELEAAACKEALERVYYGELPIQIGYCNGHNTKLNALEYHRGSEINAAATDAILLLGLEADITKDFTYDTAKVEAFKVPAGTAVELFASTLHYAPCNANDGGFQVAIVLPKGTNEPLSGAHDAGGEDALLTAKNRWLIGHPEGGFTGSEHIGLIGENIEI